MIRAAIIGSISVSFLALAGCQGEPVPIGKFRGLRNLALNPDTDPVVANQLRKVTLTIDADRKAILEDKSVPWDGLITRDGSTLNFEVLAISGINIAKQPPEAPRKLVFKILSPDTLQYDGTTLKIVKEP